MGSWFESQTGKMLRKKVKQKKHTHIKKKSERSQKTKVIIKSETKINIYAPPKPLFYKHTIFSKHMFNM